MQLKFDLKNYNVITTKKQQKEMLIKISFYLLLTLSIFCNSCTPFSSMPKDWNWGFRPVLTSGTQYFPSASTPYGKGFRDGCSNAMKSINKGSQAFFGPQMDFALSKKYPDYNQGMADGSDHCINIINWEVP
jgi:hypothetical protein